MKKTILKIQRKLHPSKIQRFYENLFHFALNGMGYGYGGEMEISGEKDLLNYLKSIFKVPHLNRRKGQFLDHICQLCLHHLDTHNLPATHI